MLLLSLLHTLSEQPTLKAYLVKDDSCTQTCALLYDNKEEQKACTQACAENTHPRSYPILPEKKVIKADSQKEPQKKNL